MLTKQNFISSAAQLSPDRGIAGGAEIDAAGINGLGAVKIGIPDHQAIDLLLILVVVEAQGVPEFMKGDFREALGEEFFWWAVQGQRVNAGCCRWQSEVGVSKKEVVAG